MLNKRNYNVLFHTHTVSGITISVLLYVIFFAGAFALFKDEITAWEKGTHLQLEKSKELDLDRLIETLQILGTTRRRFRQNLAWALLYNATAIPLAALGLLNPLFAALAMSSSSLLVVWNSSRPLGGRLVYDAAAATQGNA